MEDQGEQDMHTVSSSDYPSLDNLGNSSVSESSDGSDDVRSSNKSNTVIVRCADDVIQTPYRMCTTCLKRIDPDYYFSWEFMEFCNVLCISKFQGLNFKCTYCLHFINNTLFGKFYFRTQNVFKFFCSLPCLEHYKMTVKSCSYCLRNICNKFSSPVNPSAGTSNVSFCSEICCELFHAVIKPRLPPRATCSVCKRDKPVDTILKHDETTKYFCAKRCLVAYSFVKLKTDTEQCTMCQNYFSQTVINKYTVYYENIALAFCSSVCQSIYMLLNGKIVICSWCQNKRSHFGMIRKFSHISPQNVYICSVNCFKLYECSIFAGISPMTTSTPSTILTNQYVEINTLSNASQLGNKDQITEIDNTLVQNTIQTANNQTHLHLPFLENRQLVVHAKKHVDQRNVATMCFIPKANKDVTAHPCMANKKTQTSDIKIIMPIPVPIYVPTPMAVYSIPIPTAVPFILPVPVPVFVPIAKQSAESIVKEIQAVHNSIPKDPYEAELLKIADIIAKDRIDEKLLEIPNEIEDLPPSPPNIVIEQPSRLDQITQKYIMNEKLGRKRVCDGSEPPECKTYKRKPDALSRPNEKISLNYILGTTALQQWKKGKLCQYQKSEKDNTIFRTDILQMLADELNLVLDLFITELKKPDGSTYASDTLYYLCLGIQYYLIENGRSDNIFMDKAYNKFCDTLNKFAEQYNSFYYEESHFIVTRVEEEHLWETNQLGYHSPLVLLNTLVYFNTKYYHCSTLEQHLDVSFFQILRLWRKRSQAKSKSMILRFHPKQGKKRVYEQYPNESDLTRCPVSHYEFYLSKCPESIKNSNNLFYLQPEQYCTSDSPLWFMNSSLPKDTLVKMINRIKMVKEINIALLASQ